MDGPPPDDNPPSGGLRPSSKSLGKRRQTQANAAQGSGASSVRQTNVPVLRRLQAFSPGDASAQAQSIQEIDNPGPQPSTSTTPTNPTPPRDHPLDSVDPDLNGVSIDDYVRLLDHITDDLSITGALLLEDAFGSPRGTFRGVAFTDPSSSRHRTPLLVLEKAQHVFHFVSTLCIDRRLSPLGRCTTSVDDYSLFANAPWFMPHWTQWASGGGLATLEDLTNYGLTRMSEAHSSVGIGFPSSDSIVSDIDETLFLVMSESWGDLAIGEENGSAVAEWIRAVMGYIPLKAITRWVQKQLDNGTIGDFLTWLKRGFIRRGAASLSTVLLLRGGGFGDLIDLHAQVPVELQPRFRYIVSDLITQMLGRVSPESSNATQEAYTVAFMMFVESRILTDIEVRKRRVDLSR